MLTVAALLALTLATIASAHVPPAPTTPTPGAPSPPTDPSPQTPPTTPTTPPPTDVNNPPCCDVLKGVPGCRDQIHKTFTTISGGVSASREASVDISGSYVKLGSACCQIINSVSDVCWKMMFPKCPVALFFRGTCSVFGTDEQKPSLMNSVQCISALRKIPGCMKQVNETASLLTRFSIQGMKTHKGMRTEILGMGQTCCQAAGGITDSCWQEMYPKYPAVPRLVKGVCSVVDRAAAVGGGGRVKEAIMNHREERMQGQGSVHIVGDGNVKEAILNHREERLQKMKDSAGGGDGKLPVAPPVA
ncbi:unnamed protein product [Linum trigynum]